MTRNERDLTRISQDMGFAVVGHRGNQVFLRHAKTGVHVVANRQGSIRRQSLQADLRRKLRTPRRA